MSNDDKNWLKAWIWFGMWMIGAINFVLLTAILLTLNDIRDILLMLKGAK